MKRCRLSLSTDPTYANVNAVRIAVDAVAADHFGVQTDRRELMELCLIVAELLNNAVEHSGCRTMEVTLALDEREATLELSYDGTPFDPTVPSALPDADDPAGLPEGGFGLALVQRLADRLEYAYRAERNRVTLRKAIAPPP